MPVSLVQVALEEQQHHPQIIVGLKHQYGPEAVEVVPLAFGDYLFYGAPIDSHTPSVAIELNSVSNFLQKISTEELVYQVTGMLENFDVTIVIIQGDFRPDEDGYVKLYGAKGGHSGIKYDRAKDIIVAAESHGVIFDYSRNLDDSLTCLIRHINIWSKPPEERKLFRARKQRPQRRVPVGEPMDSRVLYLMGAPSIGEDRAVAGLKHYKSLAVLHELAITGNVKALREIPGWGKGTVDTFVRFIREEIFT